MKENHDTALLILAAGESRRMGAKIKQLLAWQNTSLLGNSIAQAKNAGFKDIFVVLGAHIETIKNAIAKETVTIVENHEWQQGMGSSIMAGVRHLNALPNRYKGVLVILVDQPLIDSSYLKKLIAQRENTNSTIIATAYNDSAGVPAYFDAIHFDDLMKLNKDFGARKIIKTNDPFILNAEGKELDIDTWEAYQNLLRS